MFWARHVAANLWTSSNDVFALSSMTAYQEGPRRKSPAGRTSSTGRALPSRVVSTAEEVQGDEYFEVEDIRGWRQGEEGREYLVKVGRVWAQGQYLGTRYASRAMS